MKKKATMPLYTTFNPLDKTQLGKSVAEALLNTEVHTLPPQPFIGAGIYALYYTGSFELYKPISEANIDNKYSQPIYVGKAVPAGARKGGFKLENDPKMVLHQRLYEHAESINQASNLSLFDFKCRFLSVDDIWIPLAESMLIEMFSPIWNKQIDGFGNHDPGMGRSNQKNSSWDVLHPGRNWAYKLKPNSQTMEQICEKGAVFLSNRR